MSGTPSCVPPNHTQPRSPLPRVMRLAAWTCTVVDGRNASRRRGSLVRVRRTPAGGRGADVVPAVVMGPPPRSVAGGRRRCSRLRRGGGEVGGSGLFQVHQVGGDGGQGVALGQALCGLLTGGRVDTGRDAGGGGSLPHGLQRRLELLGNGWVVGE